MRFVFMAGLVAFVLASAGFVLTKGGAGAAPAAASAETAQVGAEPDRRGADPAPERSGGLLEKLLQVATGGSPDAATENEGDVYYQYVDATGSVHFVQGLDQVPPEFRERAGRVEVETPRIARAEPVGRSARRPFAGSGGHDVVVYTTSWCGWCRKTIAWLDQQGIPYVNKDIESDDRYRAELIEKTGRTTIPVVEIDGQLVRGYDPSGMQRLLGT